MSLNAPVQLARELERLALEHRRRPPGESRRDLLHTAGELLGRADALGVPDIIAVAHMRTGSLLRAEGRYQEAIAQADQALRVLRSLRKDDLQVSLLALRADCQAALGDWPALLATAQQGIDLVERYRYTISAPYLKAAYLRSSIRLYSSGVRAALQLDRLDEALRIAELSKCRGISAAGRTAPQTGVTGDLQNLHARFAELDEKIERARQRGREPATLLNERRALWDLLEIERNRSLDPNRHIPDFDLSAIQAALQPAQACLYYYWLNPGQLLRVALDREAIAHDLIDVPSATRESLARYAADLQSMTDASARTLIENVQDFLTLLWPGRHPEMRAILARAERLVLSPHRLLHAIPFAALRPDDEYLVRTHALRVTPNLTALLAPGPGEARRTSLLGIGVTNYAVPGASLPPLPDAGSEIAAIVEAYRAAGGTADSLVDTRATRKNLEECLRQHRPAILHLACHGTNIESDTPLESRLYLAREVLEGLDIPFLPLHASLVILSACSSGQRAIGGRGLAELPGDELFGLPAAFLAGGVREIIASLYPVESGPARIISQGLHRYLLDGRPADVALQAAICDYLDQARVLRRRPYYWAFFYLTALGPSPVSPGIPN